VLFLFLNLLILIRNKNGYFPIFSVAIHPRKRTFHFPICGKSRRRSEMKSSERQTALLELYQKIESLSTAENGDIAARIEQLRAQAGDMLRQSETRVSRYLRASRVLVKNPDMDKKRLAAEAGISESAAGYCIAAFKAVTQALREAGTLPPIAEHPPEPQAPAEKPKPPAKLAKGVTKKDNPQSAAAVEEAKAA
jgi:hypothetical protein